MAEVPIEEKPRRRGLTTVLVILLVLLIAAAVWYFGLGAPGLEMDQGGTMPEVEDVREVDPGP